MSLKRVISSQYKEMVDSAFKPLSHVKMPPEGWICTIRKALGMSRIQLANKLSVSRVQVFKFEKEELKGNVTIRSMKRIAEILGCRFVYAMIPQKKIDDLINDQARRKAKHIVTKANVQMALENQLLTDDKIKFEINRLTQEILNEMPADLWDNEEE